MTSGSTRRSKSYRVPNRSDALGQMTPHSAETGAARALYVGVQMDKWVKWMAVACLLMLFPVATFGVIMALLGHPYFLLLLLLLFLIRPLFKLSGR